MSAIRPDLPVFNPPTASGSTGAARDAQAAFFRTALRQAAAPAAQVSARPTPQAAPQVAPAVAPQAVAATSRASAPDPERPLRPGSLLDIRI